MTRLRYASVGFVRLQAFVLLSAAGLAAATAGTFAQEAEIARQLSGASASEVTRALVASGMNRAAVRTQLRRLGYDPYLGDPYFDAIESGLDSPRSAVDNSTLEAFRGIGLFDTTAIELLRPSLADSVDDLTSEGPQVFGRRVFRQTTSRFDPLLTGPVGDDYVLGPGDRITLIITGSVEAVREQLIVSREGFLVIPDIGQVAVVGLTVEELRERLFTRLRQAYSGISRGPDADTFFSVSIAGLRTIQVRVLGEVVRPGSYHLSSVATVLEALYFAGGPTDQGTYRRVMLRRGRDVPLEVDLYPYLTSGSLSKDHRLQSGDVVFVPEVGRQATVEGEVRRTAIFELAQGEGLKDLLRFAGGLLPSAATHRAAVERILPSADRSPGLDRVMVDAPLAAVMEGTESFDVLPGDQVHVYPVNPRLGRTVTVRGAVWHPGQYELRSGMTLAALIERAGGVFPDALMDEITLTRLNPELNRWELTERPVAMQTELADQDLVTVYSRRELAIADSISVSGWVKQPGRLPYFAGMLAGDAVMSAGGFLPGAATSVVDVVLPDTLMGTGARRSKLVRLRNLVGDLGSDAEPENGYGEGLVFETAVPLLPQAEVYVRESKYYSTAGHVDVVGEVAVPGQYALLELGEHFSAVLRRAGGINQYADTNSIQLLRQGIRVGVSYERAVNAPGSADDPVMRSGDTIQVSGFDQTVLVTGAVNFPNRVLFRAGMGVKDMLSEAGGSSGRADLDRVSVRYADGSRRTTTKVFGLFRNYPSLRPGSQIFVPLMEQDSGIDWVSVLDMSLTATSTVTTLFLLIREIRND